MANKIKVYRGDDKDIVLTITDGGTPLNITGYKVYMTVKTSTEDTDANAKIAKTVTSHTTPASGITTVSLTNTDTDISPGSYYYDVQYKDTNNKIKTIIFGDFVVLPDVTRSKA
jgi:hypothetical protein